MLIIVQIAYFIGAMFLNMFLLLIARFYKKKLDPKTISFGFVLAIFFIGIAIGGVFVEGANASKAVVFAGSTIGGLFSIWNSSLLYFSMKRLHK